MPQNEGIRFTSSSIKIPSFHQNQQKQSMFLSVSASPRARKPVFEFVGSLKTPFAQFVDSLKLPAGNIFDPTKKKNKCRTNSKSLFLPSASLASNRSDDIMISEVLVRNKDGQELERKDLENEAMTALKSCRPNSTLNVRQVEEDVHRIIGSGYFSSCRSVTVNTGDNVRLVFQVEPNQEFRGLVCEGGNVLPSTFVENAFRDGYGKIVNLRRLEQVISSINDWYMDRGLFGVVSGVKVLSGGIIKLQVSEAEVNDISIRFHSSSGEPTKGTTRPETILRELTTKKGQVYSMLQGKRDAETVLGMGIMKHVSIVPQPAGDTDKVDLTVNVVERESVDQRLGGTSRGNAGDLLAGLIGSFSIFCRNLFGRNQKVDISLEKGRVDSTFRINYKDPWIEGDDKRTWRSIMVENSKTPGTENQPDGNSLTVGRSTASIEYGRPFWPNWGGTAGVTFQRVGACDDKGNPTVRDFYNNPLTASGNTHDNMLLAKLESAYTGSGSSMLVLTMEQALPVWKEWLAFNRVAARARKGLVLGPAYFSFSLSGGHLVGNFPPYEAVPIGGTNSVRGYENGAIGSGPSHAVGSAEVSFPLLRPVEGVLIAGELFADYGTDLGSGSRVPGDPAGARLKARSGYGYGAGVRVETPFGPLWLHYAFNDQGTGRFHSGVGYRN